MRKTVNIILFFLVALPACTARKAYKSSSRENGYVYCRLTNPRAEIRLFGDYWIHPLKRKYHPELSKKFLAALLKPINEARPTLFFASHTTIPPYYAATGIVYKHAETKAILTDLLKNMREAFKTRPKEVDTFFINGLTIHKFDFAILNPETKIQTSHREYLLSHDQNVFRLSFWTTDNNAENFALETDAIVKEMKF